MNDRLYEINKEETYTYLIRKANRLTKEEKVYWTVIWSKEWDRWWLTFMGPDNKLVDKM